jgi:hypothetical protein
MNAKANAIYATFTNAEYGIAALVVGTTKGKFRVSLRDTDAHETVGFSQDFDNLEDAKANAATLTA